MSDEEIRKTVLEVIVNSFEHLRNGAAELPIERGLISGVEYVPLRGNAPNDLDSLIDAAIEGAREGLQ